MIMLQKSLMRTHNEKNTTNNLCIHIYKIYDVNEYEDRRKEAIF